MKSKRIIIYLAIWLPSCKEGGKRAFFLIIISQSDNCGNKVNYGVYYLHEKNTTTNRKSFRNRETTNKVYRIEFIYDCGLTDMFEF